VDNTSHQSTTCPWQNLEEDDSARLAQILRMGNPDLQYIAIPALQLTATPEFFRIIYPALQNFGEVSQDTATLNFSVTLRPG